MGSKRQDEEEARYRTNLRGSPNRHVAAESKMLDAQHEAEERVRARRRARREPRGEAVKTMLAKKLD